MINVTSSEISVDKTVKDSLSFLLTLQTALTISFTTDYISSVGDPIANITEDMAAEQKARAVYEHLILLTDNQEVIQPLLFLRQREVVHYERFKELLEHYKKMGY